MVVGERPQDYVDKRVAEGVAASREYTDAAVREVRYAIKDLGSGLREEWQADIKASEDRTRLDTAAILQAVQQRREVPAWLVAMPSPWKLAQYGAAAGAGLTAIVAAVGPFVLALAASCQGHPTEYRVPVPVPLQFEGEPSDTP